MYTFKIRKEAVWSDGTPVTANDFVFAWRRLQDPANASKYAPFFTLLKNAEEINTGKMKKEEAWRKSH